MCNSPVSGQMSSKDQTGGYVKDGHPVKHHSEQYSLCICAFKQIRCFTLCNMSFCTALSIACSQPKRRGFFNFFFIQGVADFSLQLWSYCECVSVYSNGHTESMCISYHLFYLHVGIHCLSYYFVF